MRDDETMNVMVNDIAIYYETRGTGDDIVLIHGSPDNASLWIHKLTGLSTDYRVTAYDMRGFGRTPFGNAEYTSSQHASDLKGLIETLCINRSVIVGYSMGGWTATHFATAHPSKVRALVLTGCSGGIGKPLPDSKQRSREVTELLGKGDIAAIAEMQASRCFSPGFKERNPSEYLRYRDIKASNSIESLARLMGSGRGYTNPLPFEQIACPTLFIAGEYDAVAPLPVLKQAQLLTPNSRLVVLPAGHASMLEMPEEFNKAIADFIKSL